VRNPAAARAKARQAVDRDPLSVQALFTLAAVEHASGEASQARATLEKAVQLQPSDPQTWLALGQYDLASEPKTAVGELRAAVYLDPQSVPIQNAYVEALRKAGGPAQTGGTVAGARLGRVAQRPGAAVQNRRLRPHARSALRAPGTPPAPHATTSSKPKSASRQAKLRRV
jgi:predicted Zn-dependent protease